MSWNLPPEALLDADYAPSLWAVQKVALMVLLGIVIGTVPVTAVLAAGRAVHRNLANAPRHRKPQVRYPIRDLF